VQIHARRLPGRSQPEQKTGQQGDATGKSQDHAVDVDFIQPRQGNAVGGQAHQDIHPEAGEEKTEGAA
jgi:hypothetical protein